MFKPKTQKVDPKEVEITPYLVNICKNSNKENFLPADDMYILITRCEELGLI